MLSGDNGILQKATIAKENTNSEQIKEKIKLAELAARADDKGDLTYSSLNNELTKEFGEKGTGYNISDENLDIWEIKVGEISYEIINKEKKNLTLNPWDSSLGSGNDYILFTSDNKFVYYCFDQGVEERSRLAWNL